MANEGENGRKLGVLGAESAVAQKISGEDGAGQGLAVPGGVPGGSTTTPAVAFGIESASHYHLQSTSVAENETQSQLQSMRGIDARSS